MYIFIKVGAVYSIYKIRKGAFQIKYFIYDPYGYFCMITHKSSKIQ